MLYRVYICIHIYTHIHIQLFTLVYSSSTTSFTPNLLKSFPECQHYEDSNFHKIKYDHNFLINYIWTEISLLCYERLCDFFVISDLITKLTFVLMDYFCHCFNLLLMLDIFLVLNKTGFTNYTYTFATNQVFFLDNLAIPHITISVLFNFVINYF